MKLGTLTLILGTMVVLTAEARFTDSGPGGDKITYQPEHPVTIAAEAPKTESMFSSFSWSSIKEKAKALIAKVMAPTPSASNDGSGQSPRKIASTSDVKPTLPEEKAQVFQNWKMSVQKIKSLNVVQVKQAAVPFQDKNLVMGRNDVPVFEFKKHRDKIAKQAKLGIKKVVPVPLLNVGSEAVLDPESLSQFQMEKFKLVGFSSVAPLETPPVMSVAQFKSELGPDVVVAKEAEKIEIPRLLAEQKVTPEKINKIVFTAAPELKITLLDVKSMDEEDLKLLRALILFEKRDYCHVASGIFSDLLSSQKSDVQISAHYHLGACLKEMHLSTEAVSQMMSVVRNVKPNKFTASAITTAIEIVPRHREEWLVESLQGASNEGLVPKDSMPDLNYLKAKYAFKKSQYREAVNGAEKVPSSASKYFKAQYIAGISEHFLGKDGDSIDRLKKLADMLQKKGADKELLALTLVNLGRVSFQKAKFKDSVDAYQRVAKDNSQWLQGLTEQGWAQLQIKDAPGAIGNMHSIQSPYFDGVYKPESYIVRSIGYLNICQYADAFKTLAYFDQTYGNWFGKIEAYAKSHSDLAVYDSTIKFIASKQKAILPELPKQVMVEAARQRDFLNEQDTINGLIDETNAYPFIRGLIQADRRTLQVKKAGVLARVALVKEKIRTVNTTPGAMKNLNAWKAQLALDQIFLSTYDFKVAAFNEGEKGWVNFSKGTVDRVAKMRNDHRELAGAILKKHYFKMAKNLKTNLENNELLKYEIYAGSGENLRYQVAGGKVKGNMPLPDRKVAAEKWNFDGEYWEDEIGNYRSSLKNNCKKE